MKVNAILHLNSNGVIYAGYRKGTDQYRSIISQILNIDAQAKVRISYNDNSFYQSLEKAYPNIDVREYFFYKITPYESDKTITRIIHEKISAIADVTINERYKATLDTVSNTKPVLDNDLDLNEKLFDHQKVGVKYLLEKKYSSLFWETGAGKTAPTIEMVRINDDIKNVVVIVPKTLIANWERHIKMWYPEAVVIAHTDNMLSMQKLHNVLANALLNKASSNKLFQIVSYGIFSRINEKELTSIENMIGKTIDYIIIDESHNLKNHKAQRTSIIKKLIKSEYVTLLTGTPIGKDYRDVYTQLSLINGAPFGCPTLPQFVESYSFEIRKGKRVWTNENFLQDWLKDNTFALRKEDCLSLPDKIIETVPLVMPTHMRDIYDYTANRILSNIQDYESNPLFQSGTNITMTINNTLVMIRRLLQVCGGFLYVSNELEESGVSIEQEMNDFISGKTINNNKLLDSILKTQQVPESNVRESKFKQLNLMKDFGIENPKYDYTIDMLSSSDDKYVIFATHRAEIEYLRELITNIGRSVEVFHGGTPYADRYKIWHDAFQCGELQTLIIQPKSGGAGIDLTAANKCIIFTQDYSYINYKQSIDRLHRPGQENHVNYYIPIFERSIENAVNNAIEIGQDFASVVMDTGADWINTIKRMINE